MWLSRGDLYGFVTAALTVPVDEYACAYAVSDNSARVFDLEESVRALGYAPKDSSDDFASGRPRASLWRTRARRGGAYARSLPRASSRRLLGAAAVAAVAFFATPDWPAVETSRPALIPRRCAAEMSRLKFGFRELEPPLRRFRERAAPAPPRTAIVVVGVARPRRTCIGGIRGRIGAPPKLAARGSAESIREVSRRERLRGAGTSQRQRRRSRAAARSSRR